jgi:hypothetical protein
MDFTKIEPYYLYQTYNYNIPKIDLTDTQKKNIIKWTLEFQEKQKIAFLRLIIEHARLKDSLDISTFPYILSDNIFKSKIKI